MFDLNTYWGWLSLAAVFVLLDLVLGANFFLLWLGGCAIFLGALTYFIPNLSWEAQFFCYLLLSLACLIFWRNYLKNHPIESQAPLLNNKTKQMIGKKYTLIQDVENNNSRIKDGDTFWKVKCKNGKVGDIVKIIDVDGVTLIGENISRK